MSNEVVSTHSFRYIAGRSRVARNTGSAAKDDGNDEAVSKQFGNEYGPISWTVDAALDSRSTVLIHRCSDTVLVHVKRFT